MEKMLCVTMLLIASSAVAMDTDATKKLETRNRTLCDMALERTLSEQTLRQSTKDTPEDRIIRCVLIDYKTGDIAKFGLIVNPNGNIFCRTRSRSQELGSLDKHSIMESCEQARAFYAQEYPALAAFTIIQCEIVSAQSDSKLIGHGYLGSVEFLKNN